MVYQQGRRFYISFPLYIFLIAFFTRFGMSGRHFSTLAGSIFCLLRQIVKIVKEELVNFIICTPLLLENEQFDMEFLVPNLMLLNSSLTTFMYKL